MSPKRETPPRRAGPPDPARGDVPRLGLCWRLWEGAGRAASGVVVVARRGALHLRPKLLECSLALLVLVLLAVGEEERLDG